MSKGKIITLSIMSFLLVLIIVLFSAVFCLRSQNVVIVEGSELNVSHTDIISASGLKNGQSIFMLDKEKAISNIESAYPYIIGVQIKTTSVVSVDIVVRAREELYYMAYNQNYYILDEDLKVLNIVHTEPSLIRLKDGAISLNDDTKVSDFMGNDYQKACLYQLYTAMYTTQYIDRSGMCDMLEDVEFLYFDTFSKMVISTDSGVKVEIEDPNENLQYKVNNCFSLYQTLTIEQKSTGTIRFYYDRLGSEVCTYI